jgi:hypothetical protein
MITLVAGVSRSGKTTLAKKVCLQFKMSYFPLDSIISTLDSLYPETGIQHLDDNLVFSKKLATFVAEFTKHLEYEDLDMVIDAYQIFPDDYVDVLSGMGLPIVYLGYPHLSAEGKLYEIRQHQREKDWSNQVEDRELIPILRQYIQESKVMYHQCREHKIPFFDTGTDYLKAIDQAFLYIKQKITTGDWG